MKNRSSCNIITSHLEGRTITHKWTDIYLPTSSPGDAVIAYNKKKHKYISLNRLLPYLQTVDLGNYVFFTYEKGHHPDWREIRDFGVIADNLNKAKAKLYSRLCLDVKCVETTVEGALPKQRYFFSLPPQNMTSSLPSFSTFKKGKQLS